MDLHNAFPDPGSGEYDLPYEPEIEPYFELDEQYALDEPTVVTSGVHAEIGDHWRPESCDEPPEVPVPNFGELNPGLTHQVARTEVNAKLVKIAQVELGVLAVRRALVPDDQVDWDTELEDYAPPYIDLPRGGTSFRKEGDNPDPADPSEVESFNSLEVFEVRRDQAGYPLNPLGRTGLSGRGMLDKWGPTQAADPVVTRENPDLGGLEVLLVTREDTGEAALPGGKVETGELPWQTAGRELGEEAGVEGVALDFSGADRLYAGYADDSRNTDNAWMETTALHLHLTAEQARVITVRAGSDAEAVGWEKIVPELYGRLFSAHGRYLNLAVQRLFARPEQ